MQQVDKPIKFGVHSQYQNAMLNMVKVLALLAVIQLMVWLLPAWPEFKGIPYYLPLHTFLEVISITVSMMVFAVGWNANSKSVSGNIVLLACVFLSVGMLDFSHTASYGGMPDFFSPNDGQKHLNYWLTARLFAAVVLLVVAIRPWKLIVSNFSRYLICGVMLAVTALINWVVIYHQGWLPDTFVPGQGLTTFKKNVEYLVIGLNLATAAKLWSKMREPQLFNLVLLFGAACTLAMSEFFFTLYTTMTGSYNVLGHIYKAIAYFFIYRAIVVEVIEEPYRLLVQTKEKVSSIFDSVNDGIELVSTDGLIVDMNRIDYERMGYTREEVIGKPISNFATSDSAVKIQERQERVNKYGQLVFESARNRKDGSSFPIEVSSRKAQIDGQQVFLGISRDITERKKAEADLLRYKAVLETTHDGFWMTDMQGVLLEANHAYAQMSGYSVDELRGMHISQLEAKEQTREAVEAHTAKIIEHGFDVFESRHRTKDGHEIDVDITTSYIPHIQQFVVFTRDISLRKAAEEEIELLAYYDQLTRLPNRRLLLDRLQQVSVSNQRTGKTGALLFIDLDNFKSLNDTLGHDVGDFLLQKVAERLAICVREGDTVSRVGGDEFVILLVDLSEDEIEAASQTEVVANKILVTLNKSYQLDTRIYHNTPSVGGTLFGKQKQGIEEILKQADIAMYQAKNAGRNAFRFFDMKMQLAIKNRVELEDALRLAIDRDQFRLYYQIQVDEFRHPVGAEALIRWLHPERGMVSPVEFIPSAEDTGLILPLGQWVLETACAQLKAWQGNAGTQHMTISVNVSAKQFHEANFVEKVKSAVSRHEINPVLLKLEPTESILLENIEDTVATMHELKKIGIHFSLDDFGTGFSSLQYLNRLPLNQLKIDQSFVKDLASSSNAQVIVRTIIAMAKSLNLDIIAEGVETEEQNQILQSNGCYRFQGYLFGRPVPIDEFEAQLVKFQAEEN